MGILSNTGNKNRLDLFLLLLFLLLRRTNTQIQAKVEPYDLPVFPSALAHLHEDASSSITNPTMPIYNPIKFTVNSSHNSSHWQMEQKFIPRIIWIATRNRSDPRPMHMSSFVEKNRNWQVKYQDNQGKDEFMEQHFANTRCVYLCAVYVCVFVWWFFVQLFTTSSLTRYKHSHTH